MAGEEFYVTVLALVLLIVLVYFMSIRGYSFSYFTSSGEYVYFIYAKDNTDGIKSLASELNRIMREASITRNGNPVVFKTASRGSLSGNNVIVTDMQTNTVIINSNRRDVSGEPWNTRTNVNDRRNKFWDSFMSEIPKMDNNENLVYMYPNSTRFSDSYDNKSYHVYNLEFYYPSMYSSGVVSDRVRFMKNMDRARVVRDVYNRVMERENKIHPRTKLPIRFQVALLDEATRRNMLPLLSRNRNVMIPYPVDVVFARIDDLSMLIWETFPDIDGGNTAAMEAHVSEYIKFHAK